MRPLARDAHSLNVDPHAPPTVLKAASIFSHPISSFLPSVPLLGRLLHGTPPPLVIAIPGDGPVNPLGEARVDGPPSQLLAKLGRIDGVAAVMARTVAHPIERVWRTTHALEDGLKHVEIAPLAIRPDEVGLPLTSLREYVPHGTGVVLGVDPVTHVLAVSVGLGAHATDDVGDLTWYELLHMLVGAIVVRAIRYRRANAVGTYPGTHEQVRGRLGRAVGTRGAIGILGSEATGLIEGEVTVHLVSRDMVVAQSMPAHKLK